MGFCVGVFSPAVGGFYGESAVSSMVEAVPRPAAGRLVDSDNGSAHQKRLAEDTVGSPKAGAPTGTRADELQSHGGSVTAPVGVMDYHGADAD